MIMIVTRDHRLTKSLNEIICCDFFFKETSKQIIKKIIKSRWYFFDLHYVEHVGCLQR